MRRLTPFLLAVIMASFPPSLLLVFMGGGLASQTVYTTSSSSCNTHHVTVGVAHAAVSHMTYIYPSRYPMIVTTASIAAVSTMQLGSGKGARRSLVPIPVAAAAVEWETATTVTTTTPVGTTGNAMPGEQPEVTIPRHQQERGQATSVPSPLEHHGSSSPPPSSTVSPGGERFVAEAPPDTLKMAVLGPSRGKSASCTFALVEFSNTHHSDTIIVHSTYIEPTAVFPPPYTSYYDDPSVTTRLHFMNDPLHKNEGYTQEDRQLHIPPGTAVIVAVSIIPHWRKPLDFEHFEYRYRKLNATEGGTTEPMSSGTDNDDVNASQETDHFAGVSGTDSSSARASVATNATSHTAIHADLLDMIDNFRTYTTGEAPHSAKFRAAVFQDASTVHETLIANTSWGLIQMAVPYTCSPHNSREYDFGLPNNLMFMDGGGGWYARRNTTPTVELAYMFGNWDIHPIRDKYDPFIYRVYINNPTSRTFRIWGVSTTKPNLVGAEMQNRFDSSPWLERREKHKSDAKHHYPFKGGAAHTPKNNNIYVTTLRLHPDNFTASMASSLLDLGFLKIHTSEGSFSIALDFIPNCDAWRHTRGGVIHGTGDDSTTVENFHFVREHVMDDLLSRGMDLSSKKEVLPLSGSEGVPLATISKTYRSQDVPHYTTEGIEHVIEAERTHMISSRISASDETLQNNTKSFMRATPSKINFGSITTGSRMIRIPLKLINIHPNHEQPLRIMRISIAMNMVLDNGNGTNITSNDDKISSSVMSSHDRMEIGVDFSDGSQMMLLNSTSDKERFVFKHEMLLPSSSSWSEYPLHVWCRFNASGLGSSSKEAILQMARFYTGSIVLRATTDMHVHYRDWERKFLIDRSLGGVSSWMGGGNDKAQLSSLSSSSSQYALQIPFQGSVLPGNLGSPTESLLFPTRFHVLPVKERVRIMQRTNGKVPEYYDRELDITNNFAVPMSIVGMRIFAPSSPGAEENSTDFCQARFSTVASFDNGKGSSGSSGSGSSWPIARKGEKWKGLSIRYHFRENPVHQYPDIHVKKCILSIETDRAGKQSLPLIIYSGEVNVRIGHEDKPLKNVLCFVTKKDGTMTVSRDGMPCTTDWLESTEEGHELLNAIVQMQADSNSRQGTFKSNRKGSCSTHSMASRRFTLESYFRSLFSSTNSKEKVAISSQSSTLLPIVMALDAIGHGESTSRSIFLTNLNHAPVDVTASTAALGNMQVSIGVIPSGSFHNSVRGIANEHRAWDDGKGTSLNNSDLAAHAYFLSNSPVAKDFFSKFQYRVDISPSPFAGETELVSLYNRQSMIDTFHNESEYLSNHISSEETNMDCSRGFILATDGTYKEEIKSRKLGKKKWTIPPGGVARFTVTVKAPSRSELVNDVTPFVGTGLVLETNHGQAFPIVLTYSVIVGKVHLKPSGDYNVSDVAKIVGRVSEQDTNPNSLTVQVPLTFKDPTLTPSVDSFAQRQGVSLSVESSFAKDLYLSEVRSCNKWFNFFLPANNPAARQFFTNKGPSQYLRVNGTGKSANSLEEESNNSTTLHLGKVLSALSCSHPSSDTSFYACALAWLENRDQIQPNGCGLSEKEIYSLNAGNVTGKPLHGATLDHAIEQAKTNAIGALRDVVTFLSVRYVDEDATGKPGAESLGRYIHFSRIQMFVQARKMWNVAVKLGLNAITGHIHAKTVYVTDPNQLGLGSEKYEQYEHHRQDREKKLWSGDQPPLSIPVSSVLLQSTLEIPKLFGGDARMEDSTPIGVVDFDTVHVADTTTRYVPILNPTAMTIRVRLAAMDSLDGSFGEDQYSQKNVFVEGAPEDSHSWWTGGSYWMSDEQGSLIPASHNVTIKSGAGAYVSLLNPALHTMSAFVLGCGKRCGLRNDQDATGEEKNYSPIGSASGDGSELFGRSPGDKQQQNEITTPRQALGIIDPPSFSLGRIQKEIVIPPYGAAEIGPVYFRPPGRGDYKGTIFIENSLTGFEKVEVRGRGGWESLVFLDQVNADEDGGDVEFRLGRSALIFPGGRSGSQAEHEGGPVVKSVRLANHGDTPVVVSGVYMASSEVMHFTHKRRHPSSSFRSNFGNNAGDSHDRKCTVRGFHLPGCIGQSPNSWINTFLMLGNAMLDIIIEKISWSRLSERRRAWNKADDAGKFYRDGFTLQPNETQTIYILHYPDCAFQTSYASMIVEIEGRSQGEPTSRNHGAGSWQQTFRKRKVELLVGFDMSPSDFRQCMPYKRPESNMSIWERTIVLPMPFLLQDILSFGLTRLKDVNGNPYIPRRPFEITLLTASFILLLFSLSLDLIFTVEISATRKSCSSWKPTCRCLARADPTSSDLVSIGKEQTKHVLLSRFKKEGVLPPHCVHSDGSFSRVKARSNASGTHSEAIFDNLSIVNESIMNEGEDKDMLGLLPCGLGWRTAMRRGVGLPSSPKDHTSGTYSPELQYLTRTRDRYLAMQQEQKAIKRAVSSSYPTPVHPTPPSRPNKTHVVTVNGHFSVAKPITKRATPQDEKVEPHTKKKIQSASENNLNRNRLPPQSKPPNSMISTSKAASKENNNAKPTISDRAGKTSSTSKGKNVENGKIKVTTGGKSSNAGPAVAKSKLADVKVKQKQRKETKPSKNERPNRIETTRGISKSEELSFVLGKSVTSQKTPSASAAVKTPSGLIPKGKHNEKEKNELGTTPLPSKLPATATKHMRQPKKASNGTKSAEQQKGKQGKQKDTPKKVNTKNLPKLPLPHKKSANKHPQTESEFPPLSTATLSPTSIMLKPTQKGSVRPPPGLHAPPGFLNQPDPEVLSNNSSPAPSPQRSHPSSVILTTPGMEILNSRPLNNDLLSLLGSGGDNPLDSSYSPRASSGGALAIPEFRPQTFTPPILEPQATTETNNSKTPDVQALFGASSDFNVSNFLDGILTDSTQPTPVRNETVPKPAEVQEPIPFGVSLDPWNNFDTPLTALSGAASHHENPLAALLGAVSHQESTIIAGIPLTSNAPSLLATSSTLQSSANSTYAEPAIAAIASIVSDGGDDEDFLEPDSFYNQLLGMED